MKHFKGIANCALLVSGLATALASCASMGEKTQARTKPPAPVESPEDAKSSSSVVKAQAMTPKEQDAPKEITNAQLPEPTFMQVPEGYKVELLVQGLTYPTSITWDDQGQMYVAEAGGAFLEEAPPARILRVEKGKATELVNLSEKDINAAVVGLVWHKGAFYFTHRDEDDKGAVSKVTPDGQVTRLVSGIVDAQTDHQLNDIRVGPDGRMYVASGVGGNAGIIGEDMTPFVLKHPELHTTSAQEIVLTGVNAMIPDYRTPHQGDMVRTGAYVPFGTEINPGHVIKATKKAGGAILVFDPENAEATIRPYAWGFRNVVGMTWDRNGQMYASQNGYDVVPPRPILDQHDPTYIVKEGAWYGWPDFSAAFEPVTDRKFLPPRQLIAPVYVRGELQGRKIMFLIDHQKSGLKQPDKSLIAGLHEVNSSPSKLDVAPQSWGTVAGQLFVAEWGDMAWFNNATRDLPAGNRISRINPSTKKVEPFLRNKELGPASDHNKPGLGLERPFDVKFGPDGAMYIVDFGQHRIVLQRVAEGHLPFEFPPKTGMIWKVSPTGAAAASSR